jgi:hypothetical protein
MINCLFKGGGYNHLVTNPLKNWGWNHLMATKWPTFYKKEEGGITWQLLGDQPSRQKGARWDDLTLLGDQPSTKKKKVELFNGCHIYD